MSTAFMAEWGSGGPAIGIHGEYDALGGGSPRPFQPPRGLFARVRPGTAADITSWASTACWRLVPSKKPCLPKAKAAGCATYGCPAEEQLTGKAEMAKLGYFDGTDVSITWHLWDVSTVTDSTMTALFFAKFHFTGRSAHAGASPEAGRRALDAVELMNVGANYLREHMVAQNRLHFVITNGG
ncbi:hypothetical protein [Bilophila wadsworthia]|uniref:hypothetical protein n=1 Tax=Bilophila wadsworthia TaxID=35833 RepID=UPI0025923DF8|nr:hypothetical protein [Bilophila wadsworthia]